MNLRLHQLVWNLNPNLNTGNVFGNYDRYLETLTGKNTLHDTVGIVYQDVIEPDAENGASYSNVELEPSSEVDFIVPEKYQCDKSSISVRKSLGYKRRRLKLFSSRTLQKKTKNVVLSAVSRRDILSLHLPRILN